MLARGLRAYLSSFHGLSRDIWMLALITLINRSGSMVMPFLSVYMTNKLGFGLQEAGWVLAAFGFGSLLGAFFGGKITDKIGYFPVMFFSLFLGGCMFIGLMWIRELWEMIIYIFLLSAVYDLFRPANLVSISAYSKSENRTRSMTLVRLAINLGFSVGPAMGGVLAFQVGYTSLFIADGLTCIAAALTLLVFLRPRAAAREPTNRGVTKAGFAPWQSKVFLRFIFFVMMNAIVFMQLFGTLPVYFKQQMHFTERTIGMLMALNGLLVVVFEMPLIYATEKKRPGLKMIAAGAMLMALAYPVLVFIGDSTYSALFCILLISAGEMLSFPFSNTFALEQAPAGRSGDYMGWYSMGFSLGFILAPLIGLGLAGILGFHGLWLLIGLLGLLTALGFWRFVRS